MSLVAYGDSSSDSEVDEGEGHEDNKNSDVRKLLGLLPPPKGTKSTKQPVRIALPTIAPTNDSDDEEEESPQAKRAKMGGSGLTALLPQPKAIPKQLGSGRTAATTRSMVPYTLSKRKQDSIKLEKAKSMKGKLKGKSQASGDGSDSDEEPVSFFSHLEETTTAEDTKASTNTSVVSLSISPFNTATTTVFATSPAAGYSSASVSGPSPSTVHSSPYVGVDSAASTTSSSPAQPNSHSNSDTNYHYSWEQHTRNTVHPVIAPYAAQPFTAATYQPQYYDGQGADPNASQDGADVPASQSDSEGGVETGGGGGLLGGTGPGITIDPESLRRLAGGSKRRRREEALNNIMDVMGDDVMEDIKVYQRHYGEDPAIKKLYKPDPSKLKTPTGQQKRKHQITWLAHEAKERELELQKQWSSSNQARRDARTKYGF